MFPSPLLGPPVTGIVHQDTAHGTGGNQQKLVIVQDGRTVVFDHLQIGFVYDAARTHAALFPKTGTVDSGQSFQVIVDLGQHVF